MRKLVCFSLTFMAVLLASPAHASASFANRSLGLGASGFAIVGDKSAVGIDYGIPATLEGGLYLENGFEIFLRVPILFAYQKFGVTENYGPGFVISTGGQFGVKYLFSEESIRPYLTLHLSGLYFFRNNPELNNFFGGVGASFGVDFFVSDSVSLGPRAFADMYITLNAPLAFSLGGGAAVTTYF